MSEHQASSTPLLERVLIHEAEQSEPAMPVDDRLSYARARMAEAMQRQDSAEHALMQQAAVMAELHKHILGQAQTIQRQEIKNSRQQALLQEVSSDDTAFCNEFGQCFFCDGYPVPDGHAADCIIARILVEVAT